MKITKNYLRTIITEEMKIFRESHGDYSASGDCDDDFFGILLGYLGGDEDSARGFCELARGSEPGDSLDAAMEEFNISPDAEFEIRQAYKHIFGEEDAGADELDAPVQPAI